MILLLRTCNINGLYVLSAQENNDATRNIEMRDNDVHKISICIVSGENSEIKEKCIFVIKIK